jgi:Flp pilus assembly protein TadD
MSPQRESELLLNLGSVHHAMGEWDAAKRHYSQCLKLEPNNKVVIANMELLGRAIQLKNH